MGTCVSVCDLMFAIAKYHDVVGLTDHKCLQAAKQLCVKN